jgi:hypothetical protein
MMTKLAPNCIAIVSSALRTPVKKRFMPAVLLAAGLAAAASPSTAQTLQHGPLEQISSKPQVIRAQVELGAKLADEAITILEATDDPEELGKAKDLVKKSYELLRYGYHGCELRKHNANVVENRFLVMAMDNIMAARLRNVTAGIAIGNSIPWPESRAQFVSEALDLLRPVPVLAHRATPLIR